MTTASGGVKVYRISPQSIGNSLGIGVACTIAVNNCAATVALVSSLPGA